MLCHKCKSIPVAKVTGIFLPKKFKFRYMGLIHIKKRRGLLLKNQLFCALFLFLDFYVYLE